MHGKTDADLSCGEFRVVGAFEPDIARVYYLEFDASVYQVLSIDLPYETLDESVLLLDGTSKSHFWKPLPVYVLEPRFEKPSFYYCTEILGSFAVEPEVFFALQYFFTTSEKLPLYMTADPASVLFLINVLRVVDCIDPSCDETRRALLRPCFVPHRMDLESGLFKIPQTETTQIFLLERDSDVRSFRRSYEELELTGLTFTEVWSSIDGSADVNLILM